MAKMTQKDIKHLTRILYDIKRGQNYIMADNTHVCKECNIAMMPEHTFIRKSDGKQFASFCKEIGSDLAILWNGIRGLQQFIESHM